MSLADRRENRIIKKQQLTSCTYNVSQHPHQVHSNKHVLALCFSLLVLSIKTRFTKLSGVGNRTRVHSFSVAQLCNTDPLVVAPFLLLHASVSLSLSLCLSRSSCSCYACTRLSDGLVERALHGVHTCCCLWVSVSDDSWLTRKKINPCRVFPLGLDIREGKIKYAEKLCPEKKAKEKAEKSKLGCWGR